MQLSFTSLGHCSSVWWHLAAAGEKSGVGEPTGLWGIPFHFGEYFASL